jgi:hypothetical protein
VRLLESDTFGEIRSGYILVKARLLSLGKFDSRTSRSLVYKDEFLRVSLDGLPNTEDGALYLLPLIKVDTEDQYWSLLVKKRESNYKLPVPEYRRLGVVTTFLKQGRTNFPPRASGEEPMWWMDAFYQKDYSTGKPRAFEKEDFEGERTEVIKMV